MRKFIKIFIGLVLFASLKMPVYAAPSDPDGWQTDPVLAALMSVIQEQTGSMPNDTFKRNVWQYGYNPQDNYNVVMYKDNTQLFLYIGNESNIYLTDNNTKVVVGNSNYAIWNFSSQTSGNNYIYGPYTFTLGDQYSWVGSYMDAITGYEYSASIPNFTGGMKTIVNEEYSSPNVPITLTQNKILPSDPDYSRYNLEVKIRFALPTLVTLYKLNGSVQWDFDGYVKSDWEDLWTYDDGVKLTQTGVNSYSVSLPSTIQSWTDLYNDNLNNVNFEWQYNELNSVKLALFTQFKEFNLPMAGVAPNIADMYVRYSIKENGSIKYGRWTHIVNNQFSVVPPGSIFEVPEVPSQGQSILDNQTVDDQINNNLPDPYVLPNINVVNTVNMPDQNIMNYPTITTYNQDHLLKYAMDTAEGLPGLFTSITSFCQIAFAFIPAEIWTLIGFGFALSIVVMFMKVL